MPIQKQHTSRESTPSKVASSDAFARPFLKWAGGKRKLLPTLLKRIPVKFHRYHEPFLGGAALFFELFNTRPEDVRDAVLSDISAELINVYQMVRRFPKALMDKIDSHRLSERYYYQIRSWDREPSFRKRPAIERASRFIFLNRTCYNGLYRVNREGCFNVPFGRYERPRLYDPVTLSACSRALRSVRLKTRSFATALKDVAKSDFVYLDPPYAPLSTTSSFTAYASHGFDANDQRLLFDACCELDRRGAFFLLSNSSAEAVSELYKSRFEVRSVSMPRAINRIAAKRNAVNEILVSNY